MSCKYSYFGVFLLLLISSGCSNKSIDHTPNIADLKHQKVNINPAISFDLDTKNVIQHYKTLVELSPKGELSGLEKQRLADLELEAGLNQQLADDNHTIKQGELQTATAIQRYLQYLESYPQRKDNDKILYQLSRAYAINVQPLKAQQSMQQLIQHYPESKHIAEVQFRRGEYLFVEAKYSQAENAYLAVVQHKQASPYYEKALYKYAWSQFKQNKNQQAIGSFLKLLDIKYQQNKITDIALAKDLSRAEQELSQDVLRVISLTFSYLAVKQPINTYFSKHPQKPYEALLHQQLGAQYENSDRLIDAADNYFAFSKKFPLNKQAPLFHQQAIDIYAQAGYSALLLSAKKSYIKNFNRGSSFWQQQNTQTQQHIQPLLIGHIKDIATHYHAIAKSSKKSADYQKAAKWYQLSLSSFATDTQAAKINFLLAEALFDAKQYSPAISEYEKTAYEYPSHQHSAESGYAAIVAYNQLFKRSKKSQRSTINQRQIDSSLQFAQYFPNDPRMPAVLTKTAEQFFTLKQYQKAIQSAQRLTQKQSREENNAKPLDAQLVLKNWSIIAHSQYELKNYAQAEIGYQKLLTLLPKKYKKQRKIRSQTSELLASSIYKQGEIARQNAQHEFAALHFLRVTQAVPQSPSAVVALYDAATEYITLKHWVTSITLLEKFRAQYAKQKKWRIGTSEKLALAYLESGQKDKAAKEMLSLSALYKGNDKKQMLWQSAELFEQIGQQKKAIGIYKKYLKQFPKPLNRNIQTQHKIALYHQQKKHTKSHRYWLNSIIKTDAKAGKQRTDKSRYLAAKASLQLTQPIHQSFSKVKLTRPLKKSLKRKKSLMKKALKAYSKAAKYQVEEVTTASTFNIAQIYNEFANALLNSERPKKLNEDELEEYNYLLEDQAFPFEEKSIKIHQSNLARMPLGSFDESIKNSLKALAKLLPFSYDKPERSELYAE